jgi:hypothetical protein
MFDRVYVQQRTAVSLPRPNVKKQDAVAFDSGRELTHDEVEETLSRTRKPGDPQGHRLRLARREAVGEGSRRRG